jgi:hypothetical protein
MSTSTKLARAPQHVVKLSRPRSSYHWVVRNRLYPSLRSLATVRHGDKGFSEVWFTASNVKQLAQGPGKKGPPSERTVKLGKSKSIEYPARLTIPLTFLQLSVCFRNVFQLFCSPHCPRKSSHRKSNSISFPQRILTSLQSLAELLTMLPFGPHQ